MRKLIVYLVFLALLVISINSFYTGDVQGHSPSNMVLEYDKVNGRLNVTITHTVNNRNSHYIEKVEIYINDEMYHEGTYTMQPTDSEFTYFYDVNAVGGDIIKVEATCVLTGDIEETLTVPSDGDGDTTPPVADAGDDVTVMVGETVTLDGGGSTDNVGVVDYTWTVDGVTLEGETVEYTFDSTGQYTVVLNVSDAAGNTDTDSMTVTVTVEEDTESPSADAGSDRTVQVGADVTLDASGSSDNYGIVEYEWTLDGEVVSTSEQYTHTFDTAGEYEVTLKVMDASGNSDTDTVIITVEEDTDDGDGDDTPGYTFAVFLVGLMVVVLYLNLRKKYR